MIFQPGQKVACIDDVFTDGIKKMYLALPIKGKTYTIRGIAPGQTPTREPEIAVYLVELRNPCSRTSPNREWGFRPERFAPLEELPDESLQETNSELVNV